MKKQFAMGLAAVMLVSSLVGCGKKSSDYLMDVKYSDYVKLCDYKGLEATKVVFEVSEEEIQEEIESAMYDYVTYDTVTDRGVEQGDYANINYTATLDGEEMVDYSGEEEDVLIGEGYIFPEVEAALLGMKPGDTKTVDVKLTEDYAEEEDIDKTVSMEIKLNDISIENRPEYNDAFVKEYTDYKSTKEYEESIKKDLENSKAEEYKYVAVEEIMSFIIENSTFDGYPQELYDECKEAYDQGNMSYAQMYGMELEEFLETFGLDEETQKQEIEDNVHYELVIGAIAQAEGFDASEKDIRKFVDEVYEDYGFESAEEFRDTYTDEEIGLEVIYEKIIDFLYENATLNEISEEEYLAEQEAMYEMEEEETVEDEESVEESQGEDVLDAEKQNGSQGDKVDVEIDDSSKEETVDSTEETDDGETDTEETDAGETDTEEKTTEDKE